MIALDMPETGWTSDDGEKTELAKRVTETMKEKGPMLQDYFSLIIDDHGNLCGIPILLGMIFISFISNQLNIHSVSKNNIESIRPGSYINK